MSYAGAMARSKHGRERRRASNRSTSHSHRVERNHRAEQPRTGHRHSEHRRADRKSERKSDRRSDRRSERRHIVAEVEPLDVDGVRTVAVGSVTWIVAFVAMLPFIGTLRDHDRLSWLWICIAGFGLGLIGVEYCRRRRNLLAEQPGRRRAEASRFGAAGD
jgi:Protein of unknown function (DUF2530)